MATQPLIGAEKVAIVQMAKDGSRARIGLWLGEEFTGGELVRTTSGAAIAVEGADALAGTYSRANWLSGVASGALYAFRTLRIPRQHLVLTELCGRLGAGDMEALASAAALGIATLAAKELPSLAMEGWTVDAQVGGPKAGDGPAQVPQPMAAVDHVGVGDPASARENGDRHANEEAPAGSRSSAGE